MYRIASVHFICCTWTLIPQIVIKLWFWIELTNASYVECGMLKFAKVVNSWIMLFLISLDMTGIWEFLTHWKYINNMCLDFVEFPLPYFSYPEVSAVCQSVYKENILMGKSSDSLCWVNLSWCVKCSWLNGKVLEFLFIDLNEGQ